MQRTCGINMGAQWIEGGGGLFVAMIARLCHNVDPKSSMSMCAAA